jgi:hypothetical protein
MKVTSHSIGLPNQDPNNVAINKIWGGSEWSVPPPPPHTAMTSVIMRELSQLLVSREDGAAFSWTRDVALTFISRTERRASLQSAS